MKMAMLSVRLVTVCLVTACVQSLSDSLLSGLQRVSKLKEERRVLRSVDAENAIVGGTAVSGSEYPWIVSFRYADQDCGLTSGHFCTGSLYSVREGKSFVLSAAHCFDEYESTVESFNQQALENYGQNCDFAAHADIGRDDIDEDSGEYETIRLKPPRCHPEYKARTFKNDVCVLWSKKTVNLETVNLRQTADCCEQGESVRVIGYGADGYQNSYTDTLEYADLEYWTYDTCQRSYAYGLSKGMVCAYEKGKDACQGDSGGPLLKGTDKNDEQVGITSFGFECASGSPGVYAEVGFYYDWIEGTTQNITQEGSAPSTRSLVWLVLGLAAVLLF